MKNMFYVAFLLGVCVDMYLTQHLILPEKPHYDILKRSNQDQDTYDYYDVPYSQGNSQANPKTERDCYTERMHCDQDVGPGVIKPICIFKRNYGMTNYLGLCAINLHLCINLQQINLNGAAVVNDEIYYNGKTFDCYYYIGHTANLDQAVMWYFKLGGLDAKTQNITKSFFELKP